MLKPQRSHDLNQWAKRMIDVATGEATVSRRPRSRARIPLLAMGSKGDACSGVVGVVALPKHLDHVGRRGVLQLQSLRAARRYPAIPVTPRSGQGDFLRTILRRHLD